MRFAAGIEDEPTYPLRSAAPRVREARAGAWARDGTHVVIQTESKMTNSPQSRRKSVTTAPHLKMNRSSASKTPLAAAKRKAAVVRPQNDPVQPASKIEAIVKLLRRAEGASIEDLMKTTGWQAHSVRGAISGSIKRKLGLIVASDKPGTVRFYRIAHKSVG